MQIFSAIQKMFGHMLWIYAKLVEIVKEKEKMNVYGGYYKIAFIYHHGLHPSKTKTGLEGHCMECAH